MQLQLLQRDAKLGDHCIQKSPLGRDIVGYTVGIFMPPTSKKFGRHIGLGLSIRPSIRPFVTLALGQEPLEIGS